MYTSQLLTFIRQVRGLCSNATYLQLTLLIVYRSWPGYSLSWTGFSGSLYRVVQNKPDYLTVWIVRFILRHPVESRPTTGGQVPSIASPPIPYAEDLELRSPVGLESSSMPILEPHWKDELGNADF